MTPLIIVDDGKGRFGPMTDLRAAFELRTGMVTTAARIATCRPSDQVVFWVPKLLQALVAERGAGPVNVLPQADAVRCVNGRWLLPTAELPLKPGEALIEAETNDVIEAVLSSADAARWLESGQLPRHVARQSLPAGSLVQYPWQILSRLPHMLRHDLESTDLAGSQALPAHAWAVGPHAVALHAQSHVWPGVVFDAHEGPILVHERAVIRPGAVLCGPCSVGPDSIVIDRALIKANTAIGPFCKVGGEVGSTIFQGFANKAHDGHLGDSWVGEWVNFGAGTTNSNLLNTYGEVTMRLEPDGPRHRTGTPFLGAIVGDHAKFAIGTRLMTGTVVGTGAMIASTAPPPTTVRRFAWITDEGERQFRLDKFLEIMTTVMARRGQTLGAAYSDAVKALHARSTSP